MVLQGGLVEGRKRQEPLFHGFVCGNETCFYSWQRKKGRKEATTKHPAGNPPGLSGQDVTAISPEGGELFSGQDGARCAELPYLSRPGTRLQARQGSAAGSFPMRELSRRSGPVPKAALSHPLQTNLWKTRQARAPESGRVTLPGKRRGISSPRPPAVAALWALLFRGSGFLFESSRRRVC